jgi:hypothetical protein
MFSSDSSVVMPTFYCISTAFGQDRTETLQIPTAIVQMLSSASCTELLLLYSLDASMNRFDVGGS